MIQQLQQTFHSLIKSLEVLYVIENIKPCARVLVFEDELGNVINFFNKHNLYSTISDFKVIKQNLQSEFYSDKSIKVQKDFNQKGYFFVYLSKNNETAEKAKLMEENNSHKELGILLGYPKCCCDFFVENFNANNMDLTLKILENSNGYEFPFHNNIAARHFDVALLSHFPHSFDCKASIEIAKNNLKTIQKHSQQLAHLFSSISQSLIIYAMDEGIFLLKEFQKNNGDIIYSDVLSTTKNKLYYLLSSNNKLKILNKNSFEVSGVHIGSPKYGVIIFT